MVEPWSRCSNSAATCMRVPRKHHFPPSFPGFRSTALQRLQSILLVYRRSGEYRYTPVGRIVPDTSRSRKRLSRSHPRPARLKRQQEKLAAREKEIAREWEKRETARLKELERRTGEVLARFEDRAQGDAGRDRDHAKGKGQGAPPGIEGQARAARGVGDHGAFDARGPSCSGRVWKKARACCSKGIREPARVRRILAGGRIEVEAGFMKMQVSLDDVIEVLPEASGGSKLPRNVIFKPAPELAPLVQEISRFFGKLQDEKPPSPRSLTMHRRLRASGSEPCR
jgi:hypothetical protein